GPGHVNQPDAMRLLGEEPDIRGGPVGVGVQPGPAKAVSGRPGHGIDLENTSRSRARCVYAKLAVFFRLALPHQGVLASVHLFTRADPGRTGLGDELHDRSLQRVAVSVENTTGDDHRA